MYNRYIKIIISFKHINIFFKTNVFFVFLNRNEFETFVNEININKTVGALTIFFQMPIECHYKLQLIFE